MLEHLEDPITAQTLIDIVRIVTRSASDETTEGFRTIPFYVTGRKGIDYIRPDAAQVPALVDGSLYHRQRTPPAQGMHCALLLRMILRLIQQSGKIMQLAFENLMLYLILRLLYSQRYLPVSDSPIGTVVADDIFFPRTWPGRSFVQGQHAHLLIHILMISRLLFFPRFSGRRCLGFSYGSTRIMRYPTPI